MDDLLLGMVDLLGTICRDLYCTCITWTNHSRVFSWCVSCSIYPCISLVLYFRCFCDGLTAKNIVDVAGLSTETMLFGVLNEYPLAMITSILALILIAVFFITSADSATFVLGMQTTYGSLNPSNSVKISWGIIQSAVAAVLLFSGGLEALQNTAKLVALPFSVVIILMIVSLYKSLNEERRAIKQANKYNKPRSPRVKKHNHHKRKVVPHPNGFFLVEIIEDCHDIVYSDKIVLNHHFST